MRKKVQRHKRPKSDGGRDTHGQEDNGQRDKEQQNDRWTKGQRETATERQMDRKGQQQGE